MQYWVTSSGEVIFDKEEANEYDEHGKYDNE